MKYLLLVLLFASTLAIGANDIAPEDRTPKPYQSFEDIPPLTPLEEAQAREGIAWVVAGFSGVALILSLISSVLRSRRPRISIDPMIPYGELMDIARTIAAAEKRTGAGE